MNASTADSLARIFLLAIVSLFAVSARQAAAAEDWFTLETDHFLIHYQPGAESLARRTAGVTEQVHQIVTKKLDWVPRDKTHVVLTDSSDLANGYVSPFPYNRSVLYLSPPITEASASLFDYDDWWYLLILHEYTHVVHLDKGHGFIAGMRHAFGRVPLFFPNALNTPWVIEGLATHYETDDAAGIGRGQSTYFRMLMRAELDAGFKPVRQVNLPLSSWPGGTTRYLYGVYFFRFLDSEYGEGASERFVANYSDNFVPWRIGGILEQETGKDIDALWKQFEQWLEANLDFEPLATDETRLTRHGNFTHGLSSTGNGDFFYVREDRLAPPALMQIDAAGNARELAELHSSANIDAHAAGIAVVQPEVCDDGDLNLYYDLYVYRFSDRDLERLTRCQRLVQVSWHPDGSRFAAVQLDNLATRIVLVGADGAVGRTLAPAEDAVDIAEIDWSPDGETLVAARHHRGRGWNIELLDVATGNWRALTDDAFVKAHPRFSADGRSVLFSSEASGSFQVHAIDLQSGRQRRLSRARLGAFTFAQSGDGSDLVYVGYTSDGFDVFRSGSGDEAVAATPAQGGITAAAAIEQPADYRPRDYSPWSSMLPRWWLPVLGYTSESFELGAVTGGNDALGDHVYAIAAAYDYKNNYPVASVSYAYRDKLLLTASSLNDIDLDDDNDVERIQREDSASATFLYPLYSLSGSWLPFLGIASTYQSDQFTEDDIRERDNRRDNLAGVGTVYISAEQRARAISPGDGRAVKLVAESSDLEGSDYSGNIYTLDWREYLRLGGSAHVVGLRYVHGWGEEDPRPYRLGGVQSSAGLLDIIDGPVGLFLNQRRYTLRGYRSTTEGRRLQLATLDWRFPLSSIERGWMAPPLGMLDVSGSLFVEGGATWDDGSEPEEYRTAAGFEVLAEINLFYAANLDLRVGYAHGYDDDGEDQVYLTLGGAF